MIESQIKVLTVREAISKLTFWVKSGNTFLHLRYNDGEWISMFNLSTPNKTAGGEHHYTLEVGKALKQSYDEVSKLILNDPTNILIGSNWRFSYELVSAKHFLRYIQQTKGLLETTQWSVGDFWYLTEEEGCVSEVDHVDDKGTIQLMQTLRESSRKVIFVCNNVTNPAQYILGASQVILIPFKEAWTEYERILIECRLAVEEDCIFVWCAGFAKALAVTIKQEFPTSSHLDFGSFFDVVFGLHVRGWQQRKSSIPGDDRHWKYATEVLTPLVLGFIP